MTMTYHLRGYHRETEYLGSEFDLSPTMLPSVNEVLREAEDDSDLIDPYELEAEQTIRLAEALGIAVAPDVFDYFVESEEDWSIVAVRRDAMRSRT